ncbi:Hypothetical predicted protein [Cloeon dipterum]|uniref:Uncharacterized protein n=1 Tax=Cloeon dipterum TaxID=197152 RepID=A0A8S1E0M1_9INSE|nr:Hypothetical predicted protein [Cloeon dipterum]
MLELGKIHTLKTLSRETPLEWLKRKVCRVCHSSVLVKNNSETAASTHWEKNDAINEQKRFRNMLFGRWPGCRRP